MPEPSGSLGKTPVLPKGRLRRKRIFVNKLTDCDGENSETDSSLDFAKDCSYISAEVHQRLTRENREIGKMLGSMINNPISFLIED